MFTTERLTPADVAERLQARRTGEGRWQAKCPAHGDKGPSLSVREGDDGRVLLHCFAGCSFTEITAALHIAPSALFPSRETWRPTKPKPAPGARDLLDRLAHHHERHAPLREHRDAMLIGRVLVGGTAALTTLPHGWQPGAAPLKLLLVACQAVAKEGTRGRFSVRALEVEIDRYGGHGFARSRGIYGASRYALTWFRRWREGRR